MLPFMHAAVWCWILLPFSLHDFLCIRKNLGAVSYVAKTVVLSKTNMLKGNDKMFRLHGYISSRNITENNK